MTLFYRGNSIYFPEFDTLINSVENALAYFQTQTDYVKSLFTIYLDDMATTNHELGIAA